jgi:hypothetical protein
MKRMRELGLFRLIVIIQITRIVRPTPSHIDDCRTHDDEQMVRDETTGFALFHRTGGANAVA